MTFGSRALRPGFDHDNAGIGKNGCVRRVAALQASAVSVNGSEARAALGLGCRLCVFQTGRSQ